MQAGGTVLAAALAVCIASAASFAQQKQDITVLNERLFEAVRKNDMGTVQSVLTAGADPMARDATGQTPAGIAINHGNFDIAHYILSVRNRQQALGPRTSGATAVGPAAAPMGGGTTAGAGDSLREPIGPSWRANIKAGQPTEIPSARLAAPREPVVVAPAQPSRPSIPSRSTAAAPKPAATPARRAPSQPVQSQRAQTQPTPSTLANLPRLPAGAPNPFDPNSQEPSSLPVLGAALPPETPGAAQPAAAPSATSAPPGGPQNPAMPQGRNPLTRMWKGVSEFFSGHDKQSDDRSSLEAPSVAGGPPAAASVVDRTESVPARVNGEGSRRAPELASTALTASPTPAPEDQALIHWIVSFFNRSASEANNDPGTSTGASATGAPMTVIAVAPAEPIEVAARGRAGDEAADGGGVFIKSIAMLFGWRGAQPVPSLPQSAALEPPSEPVAPVDSAAVGSADSEPMAEARSSDERPGTQSDVVTRFLARLFGRDDTAPGVAPQDFETAAATDRSPKIEPAVTDLAAAGPLPIVVDPALAVPTNAEPAPPQVNVAHRGVDESPGAAVEPAGVGSVLRNLFRRTPAQAPSEATTAPAASAPPIPPPAVQLAALTPVAPGAEPTRRATSVAPPEESGPLAIGEFTLTRALDNPDARAKNCFKKGKLPGWYCLERIVWPANIQEQMDVDSWLFGRGRIVVHYDNDGAAQILFAVFPTEQFNHLVRFLEVQLGPATTDATRRVAVIGEPAKLNLIAMWNRKDADGRKTVLEVRKFDTVRNMIPDTRLGFISLSREGAQPIFRYVSDADLMMHSMRMGAGIPDQAPVKR